MISEIVSAFDVETITVNASKVRKTLANGRSVGKAVWKDVAHQARQLFLKCQLRAQAHFKEQLPTKKYDNPPTAEFQFTQQEWDQYVTSAMSDHLQNYVELYPEKVLDPQLERLIAIVQESPVHRLIDKAGLDERLQALATIPQEYLGFTGDVHMGRIWSFTGLQMARANKVSEYMVKAQWDNVTCPVCADLDGKTFSVEHAYEDAVNYLADDSADARIDFPRMDDLDNKSPEEVRSGDWCPPFHGRCRCDVIFVSTEVTTEPVEPTEAPTGPPDVESMLANDEQRVLYREYRKEYLDFLNSPEAHTPYGMKWGTVANRYQQDIGGRILMGLQDWQSDTTMLNAMALKVKAAEMEPGWGADVIWKTVDSDIEKATERAATISDEQYLRFRAFNQAFMEHEGIDEQILYRGTGGKTGEKIASWLFDNPEEDGVIIRDANLVGYSEDRDVADDWGATQGGVTVQRTVPRDQIVASSHLLSGVTHAQAGEREWIIFGGEYAAPTRDVLLPGEP